MVMIYTVKLKDLKKQAGLYYIGDIVSVDDSGWVDKDYAVQLLDMINSEMNQPIIDDWSEDDLFSDNSF
jgi:hypothetical protein